MTRKPGALQLFALSALCMLFLHPNVLSAQETRSFGVGVKMSTLGAGVEAAIPLSERFNVRGGFNAFSYSRTLTNDGINYAGNLRFRSVDAFLDWFPFRGSFHLSPGLLIYNGNRINANASAPGGTSFTLNDISYTSTTTDPVGGTASLSFRKAAPAFLLGWGNLVPRNGKHVSFSFEVGGVYQGSPNVALNLTGTACASGTPFCANVATDPTIQSNIQAQQTKINSDVSAIKFYPIISGGVGFRF